MQVATWLPRTVLPFAAPSRPELLVQPEAAPKPEPTRVPNPASAPAQAAPAGAEAPVQAPSRPKIEVPRRGHATRGRSRACGGAHRRGDPGAGESRSGGAAAFSLQLLRAGSCLLLVELPTGEGFQSRDPAYLLLKDLLRAAGLPDAPQLIGEPVRWPLLVRGNMDQGPDAARDFLQGFVAARMEEGAGCSCLWLVGLPAIRFAGEADADAYGRELQVEGLGAACRARAGTADGRTATQGRALAGHAPGDATLEIR